VKGFKYLTDDLKWTTNTDNVEKKKQQRLVNLRRLKKFGLAPKTYTNFYRCTIESILSGCIIARYSNCTTHNPGLSRRWCGLPNSSAGSHSLPSLTLTAPDVTGRPK
jgi:hypothetical protein